MAQHARAEIAQLLTAVTSLANKLLDLEIEESRRKAFSPSELEAAILKAIGRGQLQPKTIQAACKPLALCEIGASYVPLAPRRTGPILGYAHSR